MNAVTLKLFPQQDPHAALLFRKTLHQRRILRDHEKRLVEIDIGVQILDEIRQIRKAFACRIPIASVHILYGKVSPTTPSHCC